MAVAGLHVFSNSWALAGEQLLSGACSSHEERSRGTEEIHISTLDSHIPVYMAQTQISGAEK